MLKYVLTIFIIITLGDSSFGKGASGEYLLTGNAFDKNNQAIRNGILYIKFKGEIDSIKTDELGGYELSIPWQTACPSHFLIFTGIENEKLNPKSIYIAFQGDSLEIENKWNEYDDKSTPIKMDLRFGESSIKHTQGIISIMIYIGLGLGIAGLIIFLFKRKISKTS
jgi:hypothetical protein